jgi:hypothetical protein
LLCIIRGRIFFEKSQFFLCAIEFGLELLARGGKRLNLLFEFIP